LTYRSFWLLIASVNSFLLDSLVTTPISNTNAQELASNVQITDDLHKLLSILPNSIQAVLTTHPRLEELIEVVLDLGRRPEARFPNQAEYLADSPVSKADIQYCVDRIGAFSGDNRAGIEQTLHRISAIRNRTGDVIGLTCRVGRAVFGTIGMIRDLVETGRSILMLGRPGVGKTTALREIARVLADELHKRVVIIDTSNEIAGDGDVPHPAIGRARRMQVATPERQHQVMIEAVENHMPEVIVIDEIGTELEALAARTIAERGVQLVGTAHGNRLENLIKNPTLSDLVGGIQSVTLGDEEARRRGSQKTVLERRAPPTFEIAVEILERQRWVIHDQVAETVDSLLRGRQPNLQVRTISETGKVVITHELSSLPETESVGFQPQRNASVWKGGWRSSGQMMPPTKQRGAETSYRSSRSAISSELTPEQSFEQMLNDSFYGNEPLNPATLEASGVGTLIGPNGEDLPLQIYPYAVSRQQLEQIIQTLNLPLTLTKDLDNADVIVALRSHIKNHAKLRHMAKSRQIPIHTVKANSIPQIARTLKRILNLDEPPQPETADLNLLLRGDSEDELEALEEARLAVEQIVLPKGQPVELLPRSASIRKMQHELVEHYHLNSRSFGDEPNRRLRIYPA
jgi:stage III sporulation protein SpoIIIAA